MSFKLEIPGPPRTKKNDYRVSASGGIFHGGGYSTWEKQVALIVASQWTRIRPQPDGESVTERGALLLPVNMAAKVYRGANRGDLLNYLAAVSDVLERAGVVANDRLITSLDGCQLLLDRENPRVEITLTIG